MIKTGIKEAIKYGLSRGEITDLADKFLLIHRSAWIKNFLVHFHYDSNKTEVWRLASVHCQNHSIPIREYFSFGMNNHAEFAHDLACAAVLGACYELSKEQS